MCVLDNHLFDDNNPNNSNRNVSEIPNNQNNNNSASKDNNSGKPKCSKCQVNEATRSGINLKISETETETFYSGNFCDPCATELLKCQECPKIWPELVPIIRVKSE